MLKEALAAVWRIVCILWTSFVWSWLKLLWPWRAPNDSREIRLDAIGMAQTYEDWIAAADKLDLALGYDAWRAEERDKLYNWQAIEARIESLKEARDQDDIVGVANLIRSSAIRNFCSITSPPLYNRAFGGTKHLIENYVREVVSCVNMITDAPTQAASTEPSMNKQEKLSILHDTKAAYGQSALVLQGGAVFGLCHLGVVKSLHLRGLLPGVISGTATGALVAALVGVHTDSELLEVLSGNGINLEAFRNEATSSASLQSPWYRTLYRRVSRWWKTGHFLDIEVLESLLQTNIGDMTFEEAFRKTGRILNITITTNTSAPTSLNYISAPNVLIRSGALASNATPSSALYKPVTILAKNWDDTIIPWDLAAEVSSKPLPHLSPRARESPLLSLRRLFRVNHYIVSQARPYLAPFLRNDLQKPNPRHEGRLRFVMPILRWLVRDCQHYLTQLDKFGFVPASTRRFLLDEDIPGQKILIVPEVAPSDFKRLLENPTRSGIDYWIHKGEQSVWPAVSALNVRCGIETALDRGHETVKRRPNVVAATKKSTVKGHSTARKKKAASHA